MSRWRRSLKLVIGAMVIAAAASAQLQEGTSLGGTPARLEGFHLYNVTVYESYYSSLMTLGLPAGYDLAAGGSATLNWTRTRPTSSLFLSYTPTYIRDTTHPELSSLNHSFSLSIDHNVHSTWNPTFGVSMGVMNIDQFLFEPNLFTQVTQVATTADELAAALLSNTTFDNAYLAALLTGAPVLESPARNVFFGSRMLNTAVQAALTHRHRRLSISFLGGGTRLQSLSGPGGQAQYLVPSATSGHVGVNLLYSLSPRTEMGVNASSQRTLSRFEDSYTSTVTATFGRRMSQRWFVQMHGGTGFFNPVRSIAPLPGGPQYLVGGGLGFKTQSHSFLLSVDRNISDVYGYGSSSNLSTTGAWNWGRRNRRWSILASGSYQQIRGADFPEINAWLVNAGFSQRLSRATSLNITYAYMRAGNYPGLLGNGDIHAVRIALAWTPSRFGN
jgi:hypothetical protein